MKRQRYFRSATLERRCVAKFAVAMRRKLRENRYKGGWQEETSEFLLDKLREEVEELTEAIKADNLSQFDLRDVIDEAADVGNMAMMLADWFKHRVKDQPEPCPDVHRVVDGRCENCGQAFPDCAP